MQDCILVLRDAHGAVLLFSQTYRAAPACHAQMRADGTLAVLDAGNAPLAINFAPRPPCSPTASWGPGRRLRRCSAPLCTATAFLRVDCCVGSKMIHLLPLILL